MTWLSVDEQDAAIRRDFPDFNLMAKAGWIGVWEGPVKSAGKTYRIRVVYFSRRFFDGWTLENPYVSVYVVDPPVGAQEEKLLPHIYWNERNPDWPTCASTIRRRWSGRQKTSSPRRSSRGRRSGCCSSNIGRSPANSAVQAATRIGGQRGVRHRQRI